MKGVGAEFGSYNVFLVCEFCPQKRNICSVAVSWDQCCTSAHEDPTVQYNGQILFTGKRI